MVCGRDLGFVVEAQSSMHYASLYSDDSIQVLCACDFRSESSWEFAKDTCEAALMSALFSISNRIAARLKPSLSFSHAIAKQRLVLPSFRGSSARYQN